jgi:hypothetical protein
VFVALLNRVFATESVFFMKNVVDVLRSCAACTLCSASWSDACGDLWREEVFMEEC